MTFDLQHTVIAVAAAALVGFSKTGVPGLGILIVPLMAMIFPAKLSVGALLPMLLMGDVAGVSLYRRHALWNRLWPLLPWVLVGTIPGAWALAHLDSRALTPWLGWLVLAMVALELARRRFGFEQAPHHWAFGAFTGLAAGFATTLGNVAGPIMTLYFVSRGLDKNQFLGTVAWYFLIVNLSKVPIFAGLGMITAETLRFDLLMLPAVAVGAVAGYYAQARIPQRAFNNLVMILAVIAAWRLVW